MPWLFLLLEGAACARLGPSNRPALRGAVTPTPLIIIYAAQPVTDLTNRSSRLREYAKDVGLPVGRMLAGGLAVLDLSMNYLPPYVLAAFLDAAEEQQPRLSARSRDMLDEEAASLARPAWALREFALGNRGIPGNEACLSAHAPCAGCAAGASLLVRFIHALNAP